MLFIISDYSFCIFGVHLILAIILFFIINWIGEHSVSIGYTNMSLELKNDGAPAFNFLIRVLTPSIFLILVSAIFYNLNLDQFTRHIYIVSILYILVRLFVNIITNRGLLLNWTRQFFYWFFIIGISILTYKYFIQTKEYFFPDIKTFANELWIIVILFIYQLCNKISLSNNKNEKRKQNYIENRYNKFKTRYKSIIEAKTNDKNLEPLIYAIMIYEDYNRPYIIRQIEYLSFYIHKLFSENKEYTLGIMQYRTSNKIDDNESLSLAIKKINNDYDSYKKKILSKKEVYISEYNAIWEITSNYNIRSDYPEQVSNIYYQLKTKYYPNNNLCVNKSNKIS